MKKTILASSLAAALLGVTSACATSAPTASQESPSAAAQPAAEAETIATVPSIPGIGPVGPWRKLGENYSLSEGPAAGPSGGVYFTDFRGGTIFRIDAAGAVEPFLEDIHAGGVGFDEEGNMIVLEGRAGQVLRIDMETGERTVISAGLDGARFNAPNDLVFDGEGGFYFSDPSQGAPLPLPQGKQSIFYAAPDGTVTRVIDTLARPNGLALSPNGDRLLVALSTETQIVSYPIVRRGVLEPWSTVFANTAFTPPMRRGEGPVTGTDGLKTDSEGNVYAATRFGIEVFSPGGEPLGIIATPERPSNLAFGGPDGKTLYVTTYSSVFSVEMDVPGRVRP